MLLECWSLGDIVTNGFWILAGRKGGARIEKEKIGGATVIHNYGAGGAGYQASW